jgi:predicted TIM-barrel fold metal-dependent hydrolase
MTKGDAAKIRSKLGHPIVDGDSHWIESIPVMTDYVRQEGGAKMAEEFAQSQNRRSAWHDATLEERKQKRLPRGNWWITTANTLDFATSMIPALQEERMDELGIDYSIIYPTRLLTGNSIPQDETRRAVCRAYNRMIADIYAPHKSRLTPAALIPCLTPQEAIDEVEYAVNTLGLKVGSFKGSQRRPIPEYEVAGASPAAMPHYIDALGLDNPYDYDPLWQKCVDLGMSVTVHQGSNGWANRMSTSNGEFNRLGHAAT